MVEERSLPPRPGRTPPAAGTSYCHQDQIAARPCRAARGCSARRSRRWRGGRSRWSRSAEVRPATVLSWPARMYSASATCWMIAAGEGQGSSTTSSASVLAIAESHSAGVSGCGRCLPSDSTRVGPFFSSSRRGGPGCEAAGGGGAPHRGPWARRRRFSRTSVASSSAWRWRRSTSISPSRRRRRSSCSS